MRTVIIVRVESWQVHAATTLRDAGFRAGGARARVLGVLGAEACCLSAQEIFDRLRAHGSPVGIASVYRALELLVELRLVQRVELGEGLARYEARRPDGDHHHHVVCDDCGRVDAFSDQGLEAALSQVADGVNFAVDAHDVVLRGACADCRG